MNKPKIFLKDFILTGKFGPIEMGMSGEELLKNFGMPDNHGCLGGGVNNALLLNDWWKYGAFEFMFSDDNHKAIDLHFIHTEIDVNWNLEGGENIEIEPWVFKRGLKFEEFCQTLKEEGIAYRIFEVFKDDPESEDNNNIEIANPHLDLVIHFTKPGFENSRWLGGLSAISVSTQRFRRYYL